MFRAWRLLQCTRVSGPNYLELDWDHFAAGEGVKSPTYLTFFFFFLNESQQVSRLLCALREPDFRLMYGTVSLFLQGVLLYVGCDYRRIVICFGNCACSPCVSETA